MYFILNKVGFIFKYRKGLKENFISRLTRTINTATVIPNIFDWIKAATWHMPSSNNIENNLIYYSSNIFMDNR